MIFKFFQTILTHSRSRVVLEILKVATEQKKRFNVYVTESAPDKSGYSVVWNYFYYIKDLKIAIELKWPKMEELSIVVTGISLVEIRVSVVNIAL